MKAPGLLHTCTHVQVHAHIPFIAWSLSNSDLKSFFQISRTASPWLSTSSMTMFSVSLASRSMISAILAISSSCSSSSVNSMCSYFFLYWYRSFSRFFFLFFLLFGERTASGHLDDGCSQATFLAGMTLVAAWTRWSRWLIIFLQGWHNTSSMSLSNMLLFLASLCHSSHRGESTRQNGSDMSRTLLESYRRILAYLSL